MSGYGTEILKGQTTYINGERVTVTDTSDAFCVTVTDSDGNQMPVRRSTLMSTPLFDFNQKIINQNRERITEVYKARDLSCRCNVKSAFVICKRVGNNTASYTCDYGERGYYRISKLSANLIEYTVICNRSENRMSIAREIKLSYHLVEIISAAFGNNTCVTIHRKE